MAKAMGGRIVGMSTALEAIAAREAGMEVPGLSLITNLAAGILPHPLSQQEVVDAGPSPFSKYEISNKPRTVQVSFETITSWYE